MVSQISIFWGPMADFRFKRIGYRNDAIHLGSRNRADHFLLERLARTERKFSEPVFSEYLLERCKGDRFNSAFRPQKMEKSTKRISFLRSEYTYIFVSSNTRNRREREKKEKKSIWRIHLNFIQRIILWSGYVFKLGFFQFLYCEI